MTEAPPKETNDIQYVRVKILDTLKEQLHSDEEFTEEMVFELVSGNIEDQEMMVPVSVRVFEETYKRVFPRNYDDALVPKAQAKAWIQAALHVEKQPESIRLKPITAATWKAKNEQEFEYARQEILDTLKKKLESNQEVTEEMVFELISENIVDQEIMVPVSKRVYDQTYNAHLDENYDDALAPRAQAKARIRAALYVEELPGHGRPKPIAAATWKELNEAVEREAANKEAQEDEDDFLNDLKAKGAGSRDVCDLMKDSADSVKANRECVLAAVKKHGKALQFAADDLKGDEEIVLAAVTNRAEAFHYVSKQTSMWNKKEFVQPMVQMHGEALKFATNDLKGDKDVVFAALQKIGSLQGLTVDHYTTVKDLVLTALNSNDKALEYATDELKGDRDVVFRAFRQMGHTVEDHMSVRDVVLTAVKKTGTALQYASPELKADREVVEAAVANNGNAWILASDDMRKDKHILFKAFTKQGVNVDQNMTTKDLLLAKFKTQGFAFQHVADSLKSDKVFVLQVVSIFGEALEFADRQLKADKQVILAAIKSRDEAAFEFVDKRAAIWNEKDFVLEMVRWKGQTLKYAAGFLKADREVVLTAVKQSGSALKFARKGLNQNPTCLIAAGLWAEKYDPDTPFQAILSVKFSLSEKSNRYATDFALAMKKDKYLKKFKTYNPNAWEKESCDPKYTTLDHPCRGTLEICKGPPGKLPNFKEDERGNKKPLRTICWRYSFRFHQEQCKENAGFMLQVEEKSGLGGGQIIEAAMAEEVGIKVFRTYSNYGDFKHNRIEKVSKKIEEWYAGARVNMDLEGVYIGKDKTPA